MRCLFAFALLPLVAAGLSAQRRTEFEGRPALVIENDRLELTVLTDGGALARIVLKDDPERLNPLWEPARLARELGRPNRFGAGTGHFVCVDGFGGVSAEERAAGLPGHGEAHRQLFEVIEASPSAATLRARLPIVQEILTRTHRLVAGENVVYVESELESLLGFDRPVAWAEHATIGAPFLAPELTVVDLAAGPSQTRPYPPEQAANRRLAPGRNFTWPLAPTKSGELVDLRAAPPNPNLLDHTTTLLDPNRPTAFVTALNLEKRLLIGYLFRREEFPWLQIWEHYPEGRTLARGLEFSTQPYDVPRREAVSLGRMFGAPTFRWLPARSKIGARFLLFLTRVPEGFRKVDDVRLEGARLVIEDRVTGRRIELAASRGW